MSRPSPGIALIVALLLAVPIASTAQTLTGRLTASFHAWERQATDSTSTSHVRSYQLATLELKGLGHRNLSFHTWLRGQGDLSGDLEDPETFRVKNLYGRWYDRERGLDLRFGRQRLYAGVVNVSVDGLWGRWRFAETWRAEAYVGVQTPVDQGRVVPSWDDNRTFGGRVLTDQLSGALTAAFSAMRRDRRPLYYDEPGIYTGRHVTLPSQQEELYGYDLAYRLGDGVRFDHQLEYERLQSELRKVTASAAVALPSAPWTADVEYLHRAPTLEYASILSVFDSSELDEIVLRAGYWVVPGLRVHGSFGHTAFDGDDAQRFTIGAQRRDLGAGYTRRTGYSGTSNTIYASYAHSWQRALVRVQTGFTSYKLDESRDDSDWSWTLAVGAQGRLRRNLTIDLDVHNLSQELHDRGDFAGNSYDLRSYLKISYWFSAGRDTRSVF
jgi:opacity protein-like surface antigen